jgi:thymidylate kinase
VRHGPTATLGLLGRVLAAFDAAEIRWALLRGRAGLGTAGHDVDLLVAGDDIGSAEDVIFAAGGVAVPRPRPHWHRFYVLQDPDSGQRIVLDLVSELIYGRRLPVSSGLETACLDRRRQDGALHVLEPTDMFWTVLLHCLLDKSSVTERRRAELRDLLGTVARPSPGEDFFEALCPPGWSAERALDAVAAGQWSALTGLGRQVADRPLPAASAFANGSRRPEGTASRSSRLLASAVRAAGRGARLATRAIYPVVWRRAGLGVTPRILDVAEQARVDATVVSLRRRPGVRAVDLLVADEQVGRLAGSMRRDHYLRVFGRWNRVTEVGLERVRVISPSSLGLSAAVLEDIRLASSPMPGRVNCRRASAGTTLAVTATTVSSGRAARRRARPLHAASDRAWEEARSLARKHGLFSQLEFLTHEQEESMKDVERARGSASRASGRTAHGKPVRVSFSGLDGSGKSSQIRALTGALPARCSVEVLWMPTRVWPEPLLNQLPPGFRSRLGPKRTTPVAETPASPADGVPARLERARRGAGGRPAVVDAVRAAAWTGIATVAAVSVGLSLRRRASSSSAELVVLDRYRLDSLVKLQCWYPDVSAEWLARIVDTLAPPPDLEFLLRVDPTVAYARKPEQWSVTQLSGQARIYDRLAAAHGHVVTLDAQEEPGDLAREVLTQVGAVIDAR